MVDYPDLELVASGHDLVDVEVAGGELYVRLYPLTADDFRVGEAVFGVDEAPAPLGFADLAFVAGGVAGTSIDFEAAADVTYYVRVLPPRAEFDVTVDLRAGDIGSGELVVTVVANTATTPGTVTFTVGNAPDNALLVYDIDGTVVGSGSADTAGVVEPTTVPIPEGLPLGQHVLTATVVGIGAGVTP